jgi:hypothetical protein
LFALRGSRLWRGVAELVFFLGSGRGREREQADVVGQNVESGLVVSALKVKASELPVSFDRLGVDAKGREVRGVPLAGCNKLGLPFTTKTQKRAGWVT